ncbi:hypothetical protein [Ottowia testudinis]|uniref:Uncharacterized protein n=1 Tax=Ottowia testudinis TaxID=2816950 RepID=A0A975H3M0_9BURK|nr:hypothetical protein [Ottowia testudinis]QTD46038.1 hypothetical protein J1M35_03765 [Ottowia testudinis]
MKAQRSQVNLTISSGGTDKVACLLEYSSGNLVEMAFSSALLEAFSVTADDLFEALSLIRLEMENHGYLILCNGARKDAYPSRMSRQAGGGRKLYLFKNGIPARREDLVDLFESTEYERVGTVAEQRVAYEAWLRSLG